MWRRYSGRVEGIALKGDPKVPETRWWNHLYLLFFVWNEVSILQVMLTTLEPYRVGYIDTFGRVKYNTKPVDTRCFAVTHGHESCRFFAVLLDGTEIPLRLVKRVAADDVPRGVPMV